MNYVFNPGILDPGGTEIGIETVIDDHQDNDHHGSDLLGDDLDHLIVTGKILVLELLLIGRHGDDHSVRLRRGTGRPCVELRKTSMSQVA